MKVWAVSLLSYQLSPARLTPSVNIKVFGVWLRMRRFRPMPIQCSTPLIYTERLYQYIFRGEPAISRLVWLITASHSSSQPLAPGTGSGLQSNLLDFHPVHG